LVTTPFLSKKLCKMLYATACLLLSQVLGRH
jgi:hypothetical protein